MDDISFVVAAEMLFDICVVLNQLQYIPYNMYPALLC